MNNRVWLNGEGRSDLLACLSWHVDVNEEQPHAAVSASFTIRDCFRQVDIDFDAATSKDENEEWAVSLGKRIAKVDLMMAELKKFRGELDKIRKARRKVAKP